MRAADTWDEAALRRAHANDYLEFLETAWARWTSFTSGEDEIVPRSIPIGT